MKKRVMLDDSESESEGTFCVDEDDEDMMMSQDSSHPSEHLNLGTQPVSSHLSRTVNLTKIIDDVHVVTAKEENKAAVNHSSKLEDQNKEVEIISPSRKKSKLKLLKTKSKVSKQDIDHVSSVVQDDTNTKEMKRSNLVYDLTHDAEDPAIDSKHKENTHQRLDNKPSRSTQNADTLTSIPTVDDATSLGVKRKQKTKPSDMQQDLPSSKKEKRGTPNKVTKSTIHESATVPMADTISTSTVVSTTATKKKKMTFQMQVLSHILTSLKPFTLKSLATELKTTDTALHNLMLSLADKGVVRRKEVGNKTKKELYFIDLDKAIKEFYGNDVPTELNRSQASAELKQCVRKEQEIQKLLSGMSVELSKEEVNAQLQQKNDEVSDLRKHLEDVKARIAGQATTMKSLKAPVFGGKNNIMKKPMSKNQIKTNINNMRVEWKSRKEKCVDFVENLADAMERKPKDVYKLLDIETDEMAGVKLPPKQQVDD